jgi:plasmid stabilization system protein ParE
MAYLVSLTERAERDLAELFNEIDAANSDAAWKWYRGLKKAVLSLEELLARCPAIPEDARFRHLLFG